MTLDDEFSNAFIARVAGLLDEFHTGNRLTLSELSTRTGLPRSSTHRLLTQLIEHGWVSKRGKTYALGRTPLEWGALARNHDRLHRAAHPVLHDLHSATGLVVHLAVLDGGDVRYVDKIGRGPSCSLRASADAAGTSHRTRKSPSGPHPTTRLSSCNRMHAPRCSEAENLLPRNEIARIRERHVAHEREESAPGVACVAAPIGNGRYAWEHCP